MQRIKLSDLKLTKEEKQIIGSYTSIEGVYDITQIGKTGFYKVNDCVVGGNNEEDLRELLSAKIMEKIGFPHADILLVKDEKNNDNGCLSINILNENEYFVKPKEDKIKYRPINSITDFIEFDLQQISTISGINSENLKERKEYLLKYLFISAIICNTDVKMDNMFIIKNEEIGKFRNPEYYDMGAAFIENDTRKFFCKFSSKEMIEQLYKQYPSQIVPFGKMVEQKFTKEDINEILKEDFFKEFSKESKESIETQLFERMDLITKLNAKEKNKFAYGINSLHEITKGVDLSLRNRVGSILKQLKEKTKEKSIDE